MYHWELTLAADSEATPEDLSAAGFDMTFGSQEEAEGWLGQFYTDLQDHGVESVTLVGAEGAVYSMGLADA